MPSVRLFAAALLLACLLLSAGAAEAQTGDRARAAAEIESLREQIRARESVLLAPSEDDRKAYAEFLASPGTGLVRLLPREKWGNKLSVSGGGAYYSFERLTHDYNYGSDLQLEQNQLSVGFAGADFGFMLNLGDVPLENVSAETEAVQFMASFKTPSVEAEARASYRQFGFGDGHAAGQWTYRSRLPAVAGNTYVLRSINYDRSDLLVAFRVARKDDDGSVVLLWKLLEKYPKPLLQRSVAAASQ
jgi:hypothetical protein